MAVPAVLLVAGALGLLWALQPSEASADVSPETGPAPDAGSDAADPADGWLEELFSMGGGGVTMASPALGLVGSQLTAEQQRTVLDVAEQLDVDPRLLAAINRAENGPALDDGTRGFGILDFARFPEARTYAGQARVSAQTIHNTMDRYRAYSGVDPVGADGRLTATFLEYFSRGGPGYPGYAPLGADNDPTGLNQYHLGNLTAFYGSIDTAVA